MRKTCYHSEYHKASATWDRKRFRLANRLIIALNHMFMSSHSDSSATKQPVTCLASLFLQFAVLALLCRLPMQQMSGPSLRSHLTQSSSVTPIYFQRDVPVPSAPEPAPLASTVAPEAPSAPKPEIAQKDTAPKLSTEAETTADSAAGDSSGKGDEQGLSPFSSWRMNSMATGFGGIHHQIKDALPVFTPEPPILHSQFPEPARGKDVVMEVVIDERGVIVQAQVLQGIGYGVESSIVETLQRWIFVPAKFNGAAIVSRQKLSFHFPG
jgi:hypothetical protein